MMAMLPTPIQATFTFRDGSTKPITVVGFERVPADDGEALYAIAIDNRGILWLHEATLITYHIETKGVPS